MHCRTEQKSAPPTDMIIKDEKKAKKTALCLKQPPKIIKTVKKSAKRRKKISHNFENEPASLVFLFSP